MVSVFRKWGRMLCRDRLYKSRPVGPELLKSSFVLCAFKNLQILDTNETCFKGVNSFRSHLPQVSTLAAASVAGVTMQVFVMCCVFLLASRDVTTKYPARVTQSFTPRRGFVRSFRRFYSHQNLFCCVLTNTKTLQICYWRLDPEQLHGDG